MQWHASFGSWWIVSDVPDLDELIWTHCTVHAAGETRLEKHNDLDYDVYHHLWSAHLSRTLDAVSRMNKATHLVTTDHTSVAHCRAGRYHSSRFYGVHDAETLRSNKSGIGVSISKNLGIVTIAAVDAAAHYRNTQVSFCVLRASLGNVVALRSAGPLSCGRVLAPTHRSQDSMQTQ